MWRDKFADLNHKLDQDQAELDVLQREANIGHAPVLRRSGKRLTRDQTNVRAPGRGVRQESLRDIDAKKKEIEATSKPSRMLKTNCTKPAAIPAGRARVSQSMEPVLLVEDKAELRAMLRKALERAGYAVEEAPDGNTAIEKVRNRRYQLVLSDLKLPGNSGIEVLREAKKVEPTLPVILMTAYGSVEEAVTAMKEGAFDFIQKPVDLDHLKFCSIGRRGSRNFCARICCCAKNIRRATAFRESSANIPR